MQRTRLAVVLTLVVLASFIVSCAAPAPQVTEKIVTQQVEKIVTQQVEKVVTQQVEKVVTQQVEKVVVVTPDPVKKGGQVVMGMNREPDMLDPNTGSSRYDDQVQMNIFDTPLYRNAKLEFEPWLVEKWAVDAAGTTWTLNVRKGVKFHDGTAFNAEALRFNFARIIDPNTKSRKAAGLLGMPTYKPTFTVKDEFTLEVKYDKPYAGFLDGLSTPFMGIVSPESVKKWGADVGRHPVGTGPFKFVEWVAKDRIVLERNPDYNWAPPSKHQGPAYLDKLVFRFIVEDVARGVALETGEIDIASLVPEQVVRFSTDPKFTVTRGVVAGSPAMVTINTAKAPTDDLKVRQAIEYALNQQVMVQSALLNVGTRAFGPLAPVNPCYDTALENKYKFDQKKANDLLEEAGWKMNAATKIREKDGKKLQLVYITFPGGTARRIAETLQAQLKAVGADVEIREMDSPQIQTARQAGEHHLAWLTWMCMDPSCLEVMLHSRNAGGGWNFTFFKDAKLDGLIDQGAQTVDQAKRCELYKQAQQLILDQAIIAPMYVQERIIGASAKVKNLVMSPHGDYVEFFNMFKQ
jgi:peptide/nickel transport system substrate-binding protein